MGDAQARRRVRIVERRVQRIVASAWRRCSGYITKAEAATRIVSAIQRVLAGGIYLSDRVTSQITAKLAGRPQGATIETLSDRELQVFELIGEGLQHATDCRAAAPGRGHRRNLPRSHQGKAPAQRRQ